MSKEQQQRVIEYARRIEEGNYTAFIDSSAGSNLAYKPEFISNNYRADSL